MAESRRRLLFSCFFALLIAGSAFLLETNVAAQRPPVIPQPLPSPNAPNPNFPQGIDAPPNMGGNPKAKRIDKQEADEIRMDVQKLYALASQLKDEIDKSDANSMLSVDVVKRTKDIEKLAKQIRDRAKQ